MSGRSGTITTFLIALGTVGLSLLGFACVADDNSPPAVVQSLEQSMRQPADSCRADTTASSSDPIGMAIAALDRARANDEQCAELAPDLIVCRGLWAAWVLDPLIVANLSPELADPANVLSSWALEQAAATSDGDLAAALQQLSIVNQRLSDPALTDHARAQLIRGRTSSDILEPLLAAEEHCNRSVR